MILLEHGRAVPVLVQYPFQLVSNTVVVNPVYSNQGLTGRVFQLRVGSGSGIGKNYRVGSGSGSGSGIGNIY